MPLLKRTEVPAAPTPDTPTNILVPGAGPVKQEKSAVVPTLDASISIPQKETVKREKSVVAMTKDNYWERKEARDIRTGECIRLSGVLQALLSSVNYGQYCTTQDKAAYLAEVKKDAKELAKFITDEA